MEEGTDAAEAEVEVAMAMAITHMATLHLHLQTLPITVHHRLRTTTDAVEYLTITHTDTRILLGRHHSNSTAVGMVQAVPGHSRLLRPTEGTLTQMAAVHHRGRARVRIAGVDITLVPQVEADMVAAAMVVLEADMEAAAVGVMDMDMAEAASIILHRIRADIVLAAMMVAIVLGVAEVRHEDVAEAEVSDTLASDFNVDPQHFFFISLFAYPLTSSVLRVTLIRDIVFRETAVLQCDTRFET